MKKKRIQKNSNEKKKNGIWEKKMDFIGPYVYMEWNMEYFPRCAQL